MKTINKILLNIFTIIVIITLVNGDPFTEKSMKCEEGSLPFGKGVLACIIFAALGIAFCIIGQATAIPGVFILVGIVLPLLVFVICIALPINSQSEYKIKIERNYYILEKWFYFTFMLLFFLGLLGPLIILFLETLIPQRVDSRAQKEADDAYMKMLKEKAGLKSDKSEQPYLGVPVGGNVYQSSLYPQNMGPNYQGGQYQAGHFQSPRNPYEPGFNPQNNYPGYNNQGYNYPNNNVPAPQTLEDFNSQKRSGFVRKKKH